MKQTLTFLLLAFLVSCYSVEPDETGLEGKPLPNFKFLLPDSTNYYNTKQITPGKPVVFFLFSPYCPYCKAEMSSIIENINELKDIRFYAITRWPYSEMKKFYDEYKLYNYSNITAGVDSSNALGDYFQAHGVPYTAIYDKNIKLKKSYLGRVYSKQIKKICGD